MTKAVLFDFDGVLTTDSTGSLTICKYISAVTGVEFTSFCSEYRKYNRDLLCGRKTHAEIWRELCQQIGTDIPYHVLIDSFRYTPLDTQMVELACRLKKHGYKVGIITDNKKDRIECIIETYGWDTLFDVVVVSADIGSGKDEEIIFRRALEKLHLSAEECLFIDNQKKNLMVPQSMGMKTIYYNHEIRDFDTLLSNLRDIGIE